MRTALLVFATAAAVAFSAGDSLAATTPAAAPAGVHPAFGGLVDARGLALYTFDWDTMKGMSHCVGECAHDWPPLKAGPEAKPVGDWTIIIREDGARQWAYKDKPIYTYANDTAGKAGIGEAVDNWKLAH